MKECALCGAPARVYCDSDRASLCGSCDAKVHGANFLVAKHERCLLCQRCQEPTPWVAAGERLGRAACICDKCVRRRCEWERAAAATVATEEARGRRERAAAERRDEDEEEDNEEEEDEDDEGEGFFGDEEPEDTEDSEEDDDAEDGQVQVVPLAQGPRDSSRAPPPPPSTASSSSSDDCSPSSAGVSHSSSFAATGAACLLKRVRDSSEHPTPPQHDRRACSPSSRRTHLASAPPLPDGDEACTPRPSKDRRTASGTSASRRQAAGPIQHTPRRTTIRCAPSNRTCPK